jgi:hypothetical protein
MYDTNGKKVSIIKKEILEVDTQTCFLNREDTKTVKESVEVYKTQLNEAKKVKSTLEKIHGSKKGQVIFRDMADLVMIVENPIVEKHYVPTVELRIVLPKPFLSGHTVWEASLQTNDEFQTGLKKKKKK